MMPASSWQCWCVLSTVIIVLAQQANVADSKFVDVAVASDGVAGADAVVQEEDEQQEQQPNPKTVAAATSSTTKKSTDSHSNVAQRQVDWVVANGGFVSQKLELRQLNEQDWKAYGLSPVTIADDVPSYGWFANSEILPQELLFSVPRDCILTSELPINQAGLSPSMECEVARNLHRELQSSSRNASHYQPYLNYIQETQPPGQLPSAWSAAGKAVVWSIVGGTSEANQHLPPMGPTDWIVYEWVHECAGDAHDEEEHYAALLTVQRALGGGGGGGLMIPLHDMLNHRNPPTQHDNDGHKSEDNTFISSLSQDSDEDVQVRSSRPIAAGEMLYTSYNLCHHCGKEKSKKYGTPEIFRDYGFVEKYPQKWIFEDQQVEFTLDYSYGHLEDDTWTPLPDEPLQITSLSEGITEEDMDFFLDELKRLENLPLDELSADVPQLEWQVAMDYYEAVRAALETLLDTVQLVQCENGDGSSCQISASRYDALDALVSDSNFNMEACNRRVSMDFSGYETMDSIQSHYQSMTFDKDPTNDDVCFDLDAIVQICGDYRPHYHEMAVHYAARYLKEVKRVLWVGGGDSMLLHEILKYPTLEFVVGLELDQKVTRYSYKHFGTQPHWDNEKVTWWYGDAAKSMLILPKEYFGTFDLVLVDLSETVMSMTVTKDLDILGALSLLVKPDGIFVKNEVYLEKLAGIFNHTILIDYDDVPVLCSQSMCLGSNKIDFLHTELTEHRVDPIMNTLKQIDDYHYKIVNDYVRNETSSSFCKEDETYTEPEEQLSSPGVITVLEAEDTLFDLSSPELVKDVVVATIAAEGLSVVSATISMQEAGALMTVVLEEGYVVARTWPQNRYCAFDIHFWSSFDKQDKIEKPLLAAVGSTSSSSSSFRIVAGGMFGVDKWKMDQMARGPTFTEECVKATEVSRVKQTDEKRLDTIMESTLGMMPWVNVSAAVICGGQIEECLMINRLEQHSRIDQVIVIQTCDDIKGGVEFHENREELLLDCERETLGALALALGPERGIGLVALDPSADYEMAQIVNAIASADSSQDGTEREYFTHDLMALAPVPDPSERWRSIFLDQFRLLWYKPFTYRAEVLFNSTDSSLEMGTFMSGNDRFVLDLDEVNRDIEQRTGLIAEVRHIHGGTGTYADEYNPSQFSLPGDYDQRGPYEQWQSQQPTGLQTIVQMVGGHDLSSDKVKSFLQGSLAQLDLGSLSPIHDYTMQGDGSVVEATWEGGHAILLWDGREHVGLNIFTYNDDATLANRLVGHITKIDPLLTVALRDEMPRGFGRVVNYARDLVDRRDPHWSKSVTGG